jgi:hypothetical protein
MNNGTHDIASVPGNQLKSGIIFAVKSTRYQSINAQMLETNAQFAVATQILTTEEFLELMTLNGNITA